MFLRAAESSHGEVGAVRPSQKKGLATTLDTEAVVRCARAIRHSAGTRQKSENRWRDSWNAYEVIFGAGALEKSRRGAHHGRQRAGRT